MGSKPPNFKYADLDEGIREVVRWLRSHGFETTDSGDGVSKPAAERTFDEPHVIMVVNPTFMVDDAQRLVSRLRSRGIEVTQQGTGFVHVEASYDPVTDVAVLMLFGLNDQRLGAVHGVVCK